MRPNEITQRDIENWNRCSSTTPQCGSSAAPGMASCNSFDLEEAAPLFDLLAVKARMADLGEQSAALAHELRQPLFSIAVANENLRMMLGRSDMTRGQLEKATARIAQQVERAQTIIERTLAYAAGRTAEGLGADIGLASGNAIEFLQPLFEAENIEIDDNTAHLHATVALCQVELEQVFVNILRNAAESIAARREAGWQGVGRITMRFHRKTDSVTCTVSDNGAGLSKEVAREVFAPFFTTKARAGTGLGLHICRQALNKVGGSIRIAPEDRTGARVELELPLAAI